MIRVLVTVAVVLLGAASLTSAGGARSAAWPYCPKDPNAGPTTLWVKSYKSPGVVGSTWCKDGGTAKVSFVGYLPSGKPAGYAWSVAISGGLCTSTKQGKYVQFGTRISPNSKRRSEHPPGIFINDPTAASGLEKWGEFGKGARNWAENPTKLTWTSPKSGTFKGEEGQWIQLNGESTYVLVKAIGSFTCSRLVKVTWG